MTEYKGIAFEIDWTLFRICIHFKLYEEACSIIFIWLLHSCFHSSPLSCEVKGSVYQNDKKKGILPNENKMQLYLEFLNSNVFLLDIKHT